ncbi:AcvB/VirJ family lysyl-phosphatidylglycerol hydrolase [Stenotrophomonas sp. YIM B06876]|uniref:virulence factor family protein n=1 Tax=Stenotrophomonas sp. YIM B06876 TaxID=3060211 RepID=UPI00273A53CD|nr:AcvB/VirJ family lysyl-phosphatidylglycerol hydrolase [Stenotrophomonas sp. YIM B06876]
MRQRHGVCLMLGAVMVLWSMAALAAPETVSHGRFENIAVVKPGTAPARVVIWFRGGRNDAAHAARIEALRADGAMVLDVDTAHLKKVVRREGDGSCAFSDGDVENFSRYVQAYFHMPTYRLPILGGDGAGAALAYAVAAQASSGIFAGLLTDGFCAHEPRQQMICGDGVAHGRLQPAPLHFPWLAAADRAHGACAVAGTARFLQQVPQARIFQRTRNADALPGLVAAARVLGAQAGVSLPPAPVDLSGIPVVEMPAIGRGDGRTFAIFVSGDGGWAGLDQEVATALAAAGIPVVGLDSLRYFWTERTPQGFAVDLERIARHYSQQWQRDRFVLIGFSQGADVLPAAINQLSPNGHRQLALSVLLSAGTLADYEFHVANWLGGDAHGLPIAPQVQRMGAATTLCVYGAEDDDALCPRLPAGAAQIVKLPGDHHFEGDYAALARTILQHLPKP